MRFLMKPQVKTPTQKDDIYWYQTRKRKTLENIYIYIYIYLQQSAALKKKFGSRYSLNTADCVNKK